MLWTDVQKDWKTLSNKFQAKWSKLTDADMKAIAGRRDELIDRLNRHYKTDKAKLEREVDDFIRSMKAKV